MNRNFYIFTILLLGLTTISGLWETMIRFQIGSQIFAKPSFVAWFTGTNIVSLAGSIFLLKYYHYKKYWFTFSAGALATLANVFLAVVIIVVLSTQKPQSLYLPVLFVVLGAGLLYSVSLIFSGSGKMFWLRTAGIITFILSLLLLSTVIWTLTSQNIQNGVLEKINQWSTLVSSLIPVVFIMNFVNEISALKEKNTHAPVKKSTTNLLNAFVLVPFTFIMFTGVTLSFENNASNIRTCDFTSAIERLHVDRNYDSLLALKNIPNIERLLSTPNPSKEAKALYRYLLNIYGKRTLSGQAWASWGYGELDYIKKKTGKLPAIRNMDFIHRSENAAEVKHAIDWWNSGGIPTIMWHWGGPGKGEGYQNSKKFVDIDKCFEEGTEEYENFWSELKNKANLLEEIRDANVPVLWRPYHELNGHWFWWGKQGPEKFKKLWITMYDYFVHERGLNNLIWVLCYTGSPEESWFPGDEYVDIVGADSYDGCEEPHTGMYTRVKEIVQYHPMPLAYHECGVPPDPNLCLDKGAMWLWWMEWHTDHLKKIDVEYLNLLYHHELIITKDEVPDIMAVYGE